MWFRLNLLRQLLISVLLLAIPIPALAQDCHLDTVVRIVDKHDQPVSGITAAELRAEINGTPVTIDSLSSSRLGIVLVLDVSPSMKHTWNQALDAAKQVVEKSENVETFIFRESIQGYAIGRPKSEELLDQLLKQGPPTGFGGTALYDTLVEIASRITGHNAAIVLISDGGDNMSHFSSEATAALFLHFSWPSVFALILDYGETDRLRGSFKKIPEATGGMIVYPTAASKVSASAKELATVALSPFSVTMQVQRPITDMAKLKLEAVGPDGKARKDIRILHVAQVHACPSQQSDQH